MTELRLIPCDACHGEGVVYSECRCFRFRHCYESPCERSEPCGCDGGLELIEVEEITEDEFEEYMPAMIEPAACQPEHRCGGWPAPLPPCPSHDGAVPVMTMQRGRT